MKWLSSFSFFLLMILTACGDAVSAPPSITPVPENPQGNVTPVASGTGEAGIEISGDVDMVIPNRGQALLTMAADDSAYYEITFNQGLDVLVVITLPAGTTPGTYDLTQESAPGEVGADLVVARELGNLSAGAIDYDENVEGTITITAIGSEANNPVSGTFRFNATGTYEDEAGNEVTGVVTVSGTFDSLPLRVDQLEEN